MAELSIIISILAALLTGGFLMIFIESQKVAGSITDRFHFVMNPFFRRFSCYVKFISSFKTCFTFKVTKDSDYIKRLKDNVEEIGRLGGQSIVSGQDFPSDYFTAKELDSICKTINNIWYLIDGKQNYIDKHLEFDSRHAEMFSQHTKDYLEGISTKYKGMPLTKDMLAKVSGDFFVDIYQPIQDVLFEYEFWQKKEKEFKILILATIVFTLLTMMLVLLLNCYIPIWVYKALCIVCCGLLIFGLFKLTNIDNLSKKIMR
ncbi:putative integral membrane protein [Dysgonomonas sp. PFB1-18]|uniref:hypothetical protein n=1 Tax=unclassified Dysgonomonas TaxID=2630389 RepID=UPI00247453AE|nr:MULTISPECIES: hypothetical protein [unclassified Dysgonomonas]MDH6310176.1 putative integral membrane protein [Dysgonomonas sp. PF1-14]MDH6340158.1 putative integral membrane protein [Dysgonomonas sp. PF1-16]MDH6381733.1 putative integral membrane protein [Dysgonomonas sp. PFB1-18]MDH6399092.1 putative integral membrane protein [Dysgonomonas sp. PF1-23]